MTISGTQPVSAGNLKAFSDNLKSGGWGVPETLLAVPISIGTSQFLIPNIDRFSRFWVEGGNTGTVYNICYGYIDAAIDSFSTLKSMNGNTCNIFVRNHSGNTMIECYNSGQKLCRVVGYLK